MTRPGWLLDEQGNAGRENLDAVHVGRYDAKMDSGAADEVEVCRRLGVNAASTVVDLGAGTGQFALAMAPHCGRVVAVDVSPLMLDRLRAKVADAGAANVEVIEGGFLSYRHVGAPADVVYSRYALHHVPDFWKALALRNIHGMLRPGGIFRLSDVVYDFDPAEAEARIEAWCATATGDDDVDLDTDWGRAELEEHVRDEHSTFTWLLEAMFARTGFAVEEAEHSADGIFATYVLSSR